MNLEEELSMINDMTTTATTTDVIASVNEGVNNIAANVIPTNTVVSTTIPATNMQATVVSATSMPATNVAPVAQSAPVAPAPMAPPQPAMVNPAMTQNVVDGFNFADMNVDINKQITEFNPLVRLTGQQNEVFRIHLLPGANPKEVKVHWDEEKGHNFCCLAQAYNTPGGFDKCCGTHDRAKQRFVVPVILVPSNRGQVQQGAQLRGELRALVVSGKQLQEIKDQAQMSGTSVEQADIIATVKDARYKTFNYAINPVATINQIINLSELEEEWKRNATNENVINLCGRLITRETYEGGYSNYDYNKYKRQYNNNNNTPTQAPAAPGYQQTGYAQTYQQGYQPQQDYNQSQFGTNPYGY